MNPTPERFEALSAPTLRASMCSPTSLTVESNAVPTVYAKEQLARIELSQCASTEVAGRASAAPTGAEAPGGGCLGISTKLPHGCSEPFQLSAPPVKQHTRTQRRSIYALLNANASLTIPGTGTPDLARAERYRLQAAARVALPGHRTAHCLFTAEGSSVGVQYSHKSKRASYSGLLTCGRLWTCPVCAAKISEGRRLELASALEKHLEAGGAVYMITRTFPHTIEDRLSDLKDRLKEAESVYKNEAWRRTKRHFGIVGTVRNLELTLGENGWHLHIHELIFTKAPLIDDLTDLAKAEPRNALLPEQFEDYSKVHYLPVSRLGLRRAVFKLWSRTCAKSGLMAPTWSAGVDVSDAQSSRALTKYVSKWGLDHEIAKSHSKKGRRGSMSPFDLLRVIAHSSDAVAVRIARRFYAEYAEAMHGARQLVASFDDDYAHIIEQESEEVLAEREAEDIDLLALLSLEAWRYIRTKHRVALLEAVELDPTAETVRAYFTTHFPTFVGDPLLPIVGAKPELEPAFDDEYEYSADAETDDCPF